MKKKNSFVTGKDKKSSQYYIDNAKFYEACVNRKALVLEAKKLGLPKPRISNYLGESLLKIANKMAESSHFRGYSFKEDMAMDAVETSVQYIDNFDPDKFNNPFAYFSQICYYAFLRRIGKERDYLYNSYQLGKNAKFITVDPFQLEDDDDTFEPVYDAKPNTVSMQDFVEKYEKGKADAKKKSNARRTAVKKAKDDKENE